MSTIWKSKSKADCQVTTTLRTFAINATLVGCEVLQLPFCSFYCWDVTNRLMNHIQLIRRQIALEQLKEVGFLPSCLQVLAIWKIRTISILTVKRFVSQFHPQRSLTWSQVWASFRLKINRMHQS